jgi:hypothetical protein
MEANGNPLLTAPGEHCVINDALRRTPELAEAVKNNAETQKAKQHGLDGRMED